MKRLFALSPDAEMLVLMRFLDWSGNQAGAAAWLTALAAGLVIFGALPQLLDYPQMNAVLFSLKVFYIIWRLPEIYLLFIEITTMVN